MGRKLPCSKTSCGCNLRWHNETKKLKRAHELAKPLQRGTRSRSTQRSQARQDKKRTRVSFCLLNSSLCLRTAGDEHLYKACLIRIDHKEVRKEACALTSALYRCPKRLTGMTLETRARSASGRKALPSNGPRRRRR